MYCNTNHSSIIKTKDSDEIMHETPTPVQVKDRTQTCVVARKTHIMEKDVAAVEVINIQELNALQKTNSVTNAR